MSDMPPITCVACGEAHIETEAEMQAARRVGISFVSAECEWTLRYPGRTAAAVIAELEGRLQRAPLEPTDGPAEQRVAPEAEPWTDSLEGGEGIVVPGSQGNPGERLCPVCHGDGELVSMPTGDNMDEPVVQACPRCNSTGRILVAA